MQRLIDANALFKGKIIVTTSTAGLEAIEEFVRTINDEPTIDAVPVVHGRWNTWFISDDKKKIMAECNECEAVFELETFDFGLCYNYCPTCGAKMDLEEG